MCAGGDLQDYFRTTRAIFTGATYRTEGTDVSLRFISDSLLKKRSGTVGTNLTYWWINAAKSQRTSVRKRSLQCTELQLEGDKHLREEAPRDETVMLSIIITEQTERD